MTKIKPIFFPSERKMPKFLEFLLLLFSLESHSRRRTTNRNDMSEKRLAYLTHGDIVEWKMYAKPYIAISRAHIFRILHRNAHTPSPNKNANAKDSRCVFFSLLLLSLQFPICVTQQLQQQQHQYDFTLRHFEISFLEALRTFHR